MPWHLEVWDSRLVPNILEQSKVSVSRNHTHQISFERRFVNNLTGDHFLLTVEVSIAMLGNVAIIGNKIAFTYQQELT